MTDLVLSLVVLAAIALLLGAVTLWRRGARKQAGLMALLVAIMAANVVIWVAPTADGDTLADVAARSE
ncbi:hypothetical protein [Aurantiacibacter luteus]|uniref:Uncharacterized protein n=1 Tax=Aurantiacibacter luteus TaxID=1581420 RepID=A0A0G9MWN9_9SPHN|nr:hypothetical protein [Aurantiacibacter luteus]KLE35187.1 hypothetical protein AAW00_01530 [Aurantiacibacter luteus]